jgi:hypothetical protein
MPVGKLDTGTLVMEQEMQVVECEEFHKANLKKKRNQLKDNLWYFIPMEIENARKRSLLLKLLVEIEASVE